MCINVWEGNSEIKITIYRHGFETTLFGVRVLDSCEWGTLSVPGS
jgi:hypothetical protein